MDGIIVENSFNELFHSGEMCAIEYLAHWNQVHMIRDYINSRSCPEELDLIYSAKLEVLGG